ncbi:MAG TPA: hypothetical protein VFG69_18405 [Nannocystaceae bacterium]|nr:hypothetical protein [Nannocystaceae bacterium]
MPRRSAVVVALVGLIALAACLWRAPPDRHVEMVVPRSQAGVTPEVAIVAARFSRDDARLPAPADAIVVVFDRDVDAVSLVPYAFLVVEADGTRVLALEAVLAPASESDENRSVTLWGDFGDPESNPPTDVIVVGTIYAEDGTSMAGAAAKIEPWDAGTRAVVAETITPGPLRCPDARQVLRTYWSDQIRGVEPADLARVEIALGQGPARAPVGFDDHLGDGDASDDNVLDLCVDVDAPIVELRIAAGTFVDAAGHPSAAVQLPVRDGPSG